MNTLMITRGTTQAQLSDLEQGRWLHKHFLGIEHCTTEQMRAGWRLAEVESIRWYLSIRTNTPADVAVVERA
jgi:hypothetical protein